MPEQTDTPEKKWWLTIDGKATGPHDHADVYQKVKSGKYSPDMLACPVGKQQWKPLYAWRSFKSFKPENAAPVSKTARKRATTTKPKRSRRSDVYDIGIAQRSLIRAILFSMLGYLLGPLLILAIFYRMYWLAKLAKACSWSTFSSAILMVLVLVPLIGLIVLFVVNQKATNELQMAGVHVGFFGASKSDLERLRG